MEGIGLLGQISSSKVQGLHGEGCDDLAGWVACSVFIQQLYEAVVLACSWATVVLVQSDCVAVPLLQDQATSQCRCSGLGAVEEQIAGSCQVGVNGACTIWRSSSHGGKAVSTAAKAEVGFPY